MAKKAQWIRAADVILIGPAMMLASIKLRPTAPRLAVFMMMAGLATVGYNGLNYLVNERRR